MSYRKIIMEKPKELGKKIALYIDDRTKIYEEDDNFIIKFNGIMAATLGKANEFTIVDITKEESILKDGEYFAWEWE